MIKKRKLYQNFRVRKLTKLGGGRSYGIILPIEAIRTFGWKERQKLVVTIDKARKRFIIEDWKK